MKLFKAIAMLSAVTMTGCGISPKAYNYGNNHIIKAMTESGTYEKAREVCPYGFHVTGMKYTDSNRPLLGQLLFGIQEHTLSIRCE